MRYYKGISMMVNGVSHLPAENSDISAALSKLTEPSTTVPISKLSVSNMVHSARKHIRRHRRVDESPLNTDILNSVLLVRDVYAQCFVGCSPWVFSRHAFRLIEDSRLVVCICGPAMDKHPTRGEPLVKET